MQYSDPYCYKLFLQGAEDKRVFYSKETKRKALDFHPEIAVRSQPKIYVLKSAQEILYVGYASQSMATRLGQGIRANGLNGYHGYKWKQLEEVELIVFVFEETFSAIKAEMEVYKSYVEAIEAELVYLIRRETGAWPKYQNEIHFNNIHGSKVLAAAEDMYKKINLH